MIFDAFLVCRQVHSWSLETAAARARTANLENVSKYIAERMFATMSKHNAVVYHTDKTTGRKKILGKRKKGDAEPPPPQVKAVFNTAEQLCNFVGTENVVRMWFDNDTGLFRCFFCFYLA